MERSKVATRRLPSDMAELMQRSRGLHMAMAALDHRERCERLRSELPRVRSPVATIAVAPAMAPEPGAAAKPLVFRKTKRELQRERELLERERSAQRQLEAKKIEAPVKKRSLKSGTASTRRPCKCARALFASTCRSEYRERSRTSSSLAGKTRPRRRLLF